MNSIPRRQFLGASAASLASLALATEDKKASIADKVRIALIGCGGMGRYNLREFMRVPECEVVGLCDVDESHLKDAMEDIKLSDRSTKAIEVQKDFRKIVERKDLDAVIIGTPDHWHAYILLAACANNKDVYCEKPLSHNIVEGRAMVEATKNNKRIVQVGTQQRSGQHFIEAVKYVREGKLGKVNLCRTWITNRTPPAGCGNHEDQDAAPKGVDYDFWLGPAPKRKFNASRFHHDFRWFYDYGNGLCNDWGVHLNDVILWAMNASAPRSIFATGGKYEMMDDSDTPDTLDVYYEYPGFTHLYTVRRGMYEYATAPVNRAGHGIEFHGSKGVLFLNRNGWIVTAEGRRDKEEVYPGSEQHLHHVQDFLHCLHNREQKPASEIEAMHRATTTAHLANISYRLGRRIFWNSEMERCFRSYDPENNKFGDEDPEANSYLLREPRKPWSLTL